MKGYTTYTCFTSPRAAIEKVSSNIEKHPLDDRGSSRCSTRLSRDTCLGARDFCVARCDPRDRVASNVPRWTPVPFQGGRQCRHPGEIGWNEGVEVIAITNFQAWEERANAKRRRPEIAVYELPSESMTRGNFTGQRARVPALCLPALSAPFFPAT